MAKNNATTKKVTNETKVVCPVCDTEFDVLDPHEHTVKNATVLVSPGPSDSIISLPPR